MPSISILPKAGFCVKTIANQKFKLFVNIAWDKNVPPPPPNATEEAIQEAMVGRGDYYVPVIISETREDLDKAGKKAVVVDAIYHSSLKQRSLTDPEFKTFLIQLAFQRIESQHNLSLSLSYSTPNIVSKGKLNARTVVVPDALPTPSTAPTPVKREALIQEISQPKGILKNTTTVAGKTPAWEWAQNGAQIAITIAVPKLNDRTLIESSTLDVENRRLILNVPSLYFLDINLGLSIDDQQNSCVTDEQSRYQFTTLKDARDFDVDKVTAEWKVADKIVSVYV